MTREEEREGGGFWRIWWICHYCDCARCQFNQTRNFSSLVFLNIHSGIWNGKNGIMVIPCPNITTIHRLPQNVQMQRTESVNLSQIDGTLICDKLWCIRDCKLTYWNSPMSLSFTYNRNCSIRRASYSCPSIRSCVVIMRSSSLCKVFVATAVVFCKHDDVSFYLVDIGQESLFFNID